MAEALEKMAIVTFTRNGGEEVRLYRGKNLDELKANINRSHREWFKDWEISIEYVDEDDFDSAGSLFITGGF